MLPALVALASFLAGNRYTTVLPNVHLDEFNVSNAVYLYPGTPIYEMTKVKGLIADDIWLTDARVVPYTAEHPLSQMRVWQKELLLVCGAQMGFFAYMRYLWIHAGKLPLKRFFQEGVSFVFALIRNMPRIFGGRKSENCSKGMGL